MPKETRWLNRGIVEALHADQIAEHGGGSGLRDEALLDSAPTRPQQKWHYDPTSDLGALVAAYGYGLVKNHPFVDGNKRASLVTMYAFLATARSWTHPSQQRSARSSAQRTARCPRRSWPIGSARTSCLGWTRSR